MTSPLPLVLIPGRMATETSWHEQIAAFSPHRPVIVPKSHMKLRSMREMARAVAGELPEGPFDLAAWSMGGYILFELYPLIAARLRRLVLISTSARPESEESRLARLDGLEQAMREGLENVQAQTMAKAVHDRTQVPEGQLERMHESALALGLDAMQAQVAAIVGRRDHRPGLAGITHPTLIIVGDKDTVTPVECALELARGIPGSQLHILADTGHCPPFERGAVVNGLLAEFLEADADREPIPSPIESPMVAQI
ncbi:MAG: alpha/beta fold hydrolase [Devosia sp.]